eukprot:IDg6787t1
MYEMLHTEELTLCRFNTRCANERFISVGVSSSLSWILSPDRTYLSSRESALLLLDCTLMMAASNTGLCTMVALAVNLLVVSGNLYMTAQRTP